jgi:hypothetical protein
MLAWPAGPRDTDGVWAPHWYAATLASTGFALYADRTPDVPSRLGGLVDAAAPYYAELAAHRLS